MVDLAKALDDACRGAEIACELMMRTYRGDYEVYTKEGAGDRAGAVLTEADLECDRALQHFFTSRYPGHAIVSEESVGSLPEGWQEQSGSGSSTPSTARSPTSRAPTISASPSG